MTNFERLSPATAAKNQVNLITPSYRADSCGVGIVHIGIGAFHRAHQAVFTDQLLSQQPGDWRIIGLSLRSAKVAEQLNPQGGYFTVLEKSAEHQQLSLITVVDKVLQGSCEAEQIQHLLAQENIKIISLTITEKGYYYDSVAQRLQSDDSSIQQDVNNFDHPKTAVALVAKAAQLRMQQGRLGFTVMSCDNLPANGQVAKQVVEQFCRLISADLASWVAENVSFVSTMVDRIVPATTEQDIAQASKILGLEDKGLVVCESYKQWVIEDNFIQGRPAWELVGAELVDDVEIYETMKLRLLNGSHSCLAYLGYLAGFEFIHQAISDKSLQQFVCYLMDEELSPSLEVPAGFDLQAYKKQIRQRFSNPEICYKTAQVGSDGSQKLPQRLLAAAIFHLGTGNFKAVALVVAAWLRYMQAEDESGQAIPVSDPKQAQMLAHYPPLDQAWSAMELMQTSGIFPESLLANENFCAQVQESLDSLLKKGTQKTITEFLAEDNNAG